MMRCVFRKSNGFLGLCLAVWIHGAGHSWAQTEPPPAESAAAPALDQLWLQPRRPPSAEQGSWFPQAIQSVRGEVKRFDAQSLEFVPIGEVIETQIASERVVWVSPANFDSLEAPIVELYRAGRYAESLSQLRPILEKRPAVWRQQWITMLAANAAYRSGRCNIALELVSQLDRRPLPPMVSAWLPIAWKRGVQSADAISEAEKKLDDASASEAVRLVAASWLLSTAKRSEAAAVIKQLTASKRRDIGLLARSLLWRTASPPQVKQYATEWESQLDQMPMVYQTGPTRALADLFQAAGLSDDAKRLNWALELVPIHPRLGD